MVGKADEELFHTQHSTLNTQHSTLHTPHSTLRLCRSHSTLNIQHSTFHIAQRAQLYPRNRFDAAIIFALEHEMTLEETNALLEEIGEELLN